MEDTALYRVVCREKQQEEKNTWKNGSSKSYSTSKSNTTGYVKPQPSKQGENNTPRPQLRLTDAHIAEKKRLGLCFTCDDKWSRQHWCPNRSLQVLTVVNGIEMKILDQSLVEVDNEVEESGASMMGLFLNSFLGRSSPTTMKLRGTIKKNSVVVMIDSRATHNFISPKAVQQLKLKARRLESLTVLLGTGVSVEGIGVCKNVQLVLPSISFTADFVVLELGQVDVILGVKWLRTLGKCTVDWEMQEWSFYYDGALVTLKGNPSLHNQNESLKSLLPGECKEEKMALQSKEQKGAEDVNLPILVEQKLDQYAAVFQKPTGLPPLRGREHSITLQPNSSPVSVRPYRYPHAHKESMEKLVQEMLADGLIRPSQIPYSSPVLLVKKKDNTHRLCVDYRALNRATVEDKYPIPMIDQLLDELHGARVFLKLDLRAGYHQIRMAEKDIKKTAFRTHDGHFEFLVMPFGLTNAPATFQALMNNVIRKFLGKFVLVFFDDIQHVQNLEAVLEVFVEQKLYANK